MTPITPGTIAVIFISQRRADDAHGYAVAAAAMEELARTQPGYIDFVAVRDTDGRGIAVSYWRDEAAAIAWRDHPDHAAVRAAGRALWYDAHRVAVAEVTRAYDWSRA